MYLCSVFTVPKHRREGLAKTLFREMLEKFAPEKDTLFYAWPYSEEGKKSLKAAERILGKRILLRKED